MTSTFINLPPPPSDPATPSEIPGTPNSGTTSLSALSTVAIKDGHQGSHHSNPPRSNDPAHLLSHATMTSNTLDAERADRISRLAGLERVATARHPGHSSNNSNQYATNQPIGYFDAAGNPVLAKERSTVGSASATGSMGGRTTWASGSDIYDDRTDKMSVSEGGADNDALSQGGSSDEGNASLVGFGEGANSMIDGPASVAGTTVSGPISVAGRLGRFRAEAGDGAPVTPGSVQGTPAPRHAGLSGRETTERIVQERAAAARDVELE